jgi:hypothetical protein
MEQVIAFRAGISVAVRHDELGRIVAAAVLPDEGGLDQGHGARLARHAAETVARVVEKLPRGPHDTAALMAQAWGYAAQQAANALRRAEEAAMAAAAEQAAEAARSTEAERVDRAGVCE